MASGDEDDMRARLDRLSGDLKATRPTPPRPSVAPAPASGGAAWSMGMKAGSEFVAAVIVGGALGFGLDLVLHTKPFLTIALFLLGVVAGVVNVIRSTSPKRGA